jgi:hypothetical protein
MKELRPGSTGRTEIRVLFAFDKDRQAVLLIGGDKSSNWSRWYRTNVPIADDRLDEHQTRIAKRIKAKATSASPARKGKKR